ncbi:MAG: phosphoribosylglycinamide formyltransferase [Butyrivibrio sp.]|nr:phosphoribosylglycinamide formyltransferase [Butyrivibrio sp.]
MLNIAVLVSGGGTNLQAIIDAIENGTVTNTRISMVYSNNRNAFALERAKKHGIKTEVLVPKEFENRDAFNEAFYELLIKENPDLIVLAGCLVVIPEKIVKAFKGRIINIHPSLIPSFCGTGFYGLKVHEEALKRGVRVSGATVHFVDEGTDTGPIIFQKAVYIRPDDTAKTLQQRIMEQAEWKILPKAIDLIANGKISIKDNIVEIEDYDPEF